MNQVSGFLNNISNAYGLINMNNINMLLLVRYARCKIGLIVQKYITHLVSFIKISNHHEIEH